jgi:hypothetical protein
MMMRGFQHRIGHAGAKGRNVLKLQLLKRMGIRLYVKPHKMLRK